MRVLRNGVAVPLETRPVRATAASRIPRADVADEPPARPPLVRCAQDLVLYSQLHVRRVVRLSSLALETLGKLHPSVAARVDAGKLGAFAAIHDRSKVASHRVFLASHGLSRPIANDLIAIWGQDLSPKDTPASLRAVVDAANRVDHSVEERSLTRLQVPLEDRALYRELVHLSDITDRGMHPLVPEEMNRHIQTASEWLGRTRARVDAHLAEAGLRPLTASDCLSIVGVLERSYGTLFPGDLRKQYLEERKEIPAPGEHAFSGGPRASRHYRNARLDLED